MIERVGGNDVSAAKVRSSRSSHAW